MKNIELMESQAGIKDKVHQFLSMKAEQAESRAKSVPFLSNIPENALTHLMGKAKTVRYLRKEVLGFEGNKANTVFIIFSGEVKIVCGDDWNHKEVSFQIQEPRSGFGKIALLTDEIRDLSVITVAKTVFAVILKSDFKNWLMNYPELKFVYL